VLAGLGIAWILTVGTMAVIAADFAWKIALVVWGAVGLGHVYAWGTEHGKQWERPLRIGYWVGVVVLAGAFAAIFIQNAST